MNNNETGFVFTTFHALVATYFSRSSSLSGRVLLRGGGSKRFVSNPLSIPCNTIFEICRSSGSAHVTRILVTFERRVPVILRQRNAPFFPSVEKKDPLPFGKNRARVIVGAKLITDAKVTRLKSRPKLIPSIRSFARFESYVSPPEIKHEISDASRPSEGVDRCIRYVTNDALESVDGRPGLDEII